jgi:hypothetical protein
VQRKSIGKAYDKPHGGPGLGGCKDFQLVVFEGEWPSHFEFLLVSEEFPGGIMAWHGGGMLSK